MGGKVIGHGGRLGQKSRLSLTPSSPVHRSDTDLGFDNETELSDLDDLAYMITISALQLTLAETDILGFPFTRSNTETSLLVYMAIEQQLFSTMLAFLPLSALLATETTWVGPIPSIHNGACP